MINIKGVKKGFTLVEMLVVISLIGILAALALVSFASTQKQARDTQRKSDLRQYQNALEAYANLSSGLYPEFSAVRVASTTLCTSLNSKIEPDISCSEDPKSATNGTYNYISDGTGTSGTATATKYVVWGKLENSSSTTYWVICSTGKIGSYVSSSAPSSSTCPI